VLTRTATVKPVSALSVTAARLSITAVVLFQAMLAIRPELHPSWQPISEYAIGRHGWIMVAFFISAGSYAAALFLAPESQIRNAPGRIGLGILMVCAVGTASAGVFVADRLRRLAS